MKPTEAGGPSARELHGSAYGRKQYADEQRKQPDSPSGRAEVVGHIPVKHPDHTQLESVDAQTFPSVRNMIEKTEFGEAHLSKVIKSATADARINDGSVLTRPRFLISIFLALAIAALLILLALNTYRTSI